MVFRLFRKKGRVRFAFTLDRPQGPYYPGDTLRAYLDVRVEGAPVKVRRLEARLFYWQRFRQWEFIHADEEGEDVSLLQRDEYWQATWKEETVRLGRVQLPVPHRMPQGFAQRFELAFALPETLEPPHNGVLAQGGLYLWAFADRPWTGDDWVSVAVPLVLPPPGMYVEPRYYGKANEPETIDMALYLPGLEFVEGQNLEGRLRLRCHQPVEGRQLRVTLEVREFIPTNNPEFFLELNSTPDFRETHEAARVVLREPFRLQPGQELEIPFRLTIPQLGRPTCTTGGNGWIRWYLQGVIDRPRARDYRVEQEVYVFNGPPPRSG